MTEVSRIYEGMFLLDAGQTDFEAATEPIKTILERRDAEILSFNPWDERRLAYEVNGRKRGQYVLTHFRVNASQITEMENDCQLDERILRAMFIRCDKNVDEKVNAETPAMAGKRRAVEADAARAARAEVEAKEQAEKDAQQAEKTAEAAVAEAGDVVAEAAEATPVDAPAEATPVDAPAEAPQVDPPAEEAPAVEQTEAADESTDQSETKSE